MHQYQCYNCKVMTVTQYQPLSDDAELERAVPCKHSNILEHNPTVWMKSEKYITVALYKLNATH